MKHLAVLFSAVILVACGSSLSPGKAGSPTVASTSPAVTGCQYSDGGWEPDRKCTPGETNPNVTQSNVASTICVSGWTTAIRPPVSVTEKIKAQTMLAYGDSGSPSDYELDHLISLELGGNPTSVQNLWPEPWNGQYGAHVKDQLENRLKKQVCAGALTLVSAQQEIANDWVGIYKQEFGG